MIRLRLLLVTETSHCAEEIDLLDRFFQKFAICMAGIMRSLSLSWGGDG